MARLEILRRNFSSARTRLCLAGSRRSAMAIAAGDWSTCILEFSNQHKLETAFPDTCSWGARWAELWH